MANEATALAIPASFMPAQARLRAANQDAQMFAINHDASTGVTITSTLLKRIGKAVFWDWTGTVLTPTVSGYNTNVLTVTDLPADVKGITVLLSGSRL